MLLKRAKSIGLQVRRGGPRGRDGFGQFTHCDGEGLYELRDTDGVVFAGDLPTVEAYVADRYVGRKPGPAVSAVPPAEWAPMIDDYAATLVAAGQTPATIDHRRKYVIRMARELGVGPAEVTGEQLVGWLGSHSNWATETRRAARSSVRLFFLWAYQARRIPVHIADDLPKVRQSKAVARPAPDHAWEQAIAAADARTMLILQLAAEAGLRRTEISLVHVRDLTDSVDGARLLVHGKGGKPREVPLSDSLAALVRAGATAHTAGASPTGWLFPNEFGEHLAADSIARIAQRVLPVGWTLHNLRHRFATRAYRGSRNLRAVQNLLGHSSVATTERYLAVDDGEIRAAMLSASSNVAPVTRQVADADTLAEQPNVSDKVSLTPDKVGMPSTETTTFESVIAGWDAAPRCEATSLITHQGNPCDPCRRVAKWYVNLHGCLQILMCGPDLQAWKRGQLAALRQGRILECVHCGQTFERFEEACSITRL
jgi:integrase